MKDNNNDDKVVSLKEVSDKKPSKEEKFNLDTASVEDMVAKGFEDFKTHIPTATAFIGIVFNGDYSPEIVHAGEMDLLKTLGTLEYLKKELMDEPVQINNLFDSTFEDDPF